MLAQKLINIPRLSISPRIAKAIIVLGLGALSAALVALVQAGYIVGPLGILAPVVSGFLTGVAALIDPNANHSSSDSPDGGA